MPTDSSRHQQVRRELDHQERFPWLLLTRCFRVATNPQILALAALGAIATTAGWRLADQGLLKPAHKIEFARVEADSNYFSKWPGQRIESATKIAPFLSAVTKPLEDVFGPAPDDPIFSIPSRVVGAAGGFARRESTLVVACYYLLGGLWTVFVWSGFGCAIVRMASQRYTRDDVVSLVDGLAFSQSKILSCLGGVLGPLLGALVLSLPMLAMGLLIRTSFGSAIAGVLWLFVVPLSLIVSIILLGLMFGWPLMWGAVATESSDAFDAVSRSYSYTFQRPLHYLMYVLLAAGLGMLGWIVVWIVSELIANVGLWAAGLTAGHDRIAGLLATGGADAGGPRAFGGTMIWFWNGLVRTFASAYGYSYFWCAIAAIYLLLRKHVDGVELDEIKLESDTAYRLPQLQPDAAETPQSSSRDDAGEQASDTSAS